MPSAAATSLAWTPFSSGLPPYKPRYICVTGGEPLAQPNCISLLERLCDAGYEVSLETSGALDVSRIDPRVSKVLDLKTPGSGEVGRNRYENIPLLTDNDQVKFVVCSREDYDWAVSKLIEYRLDQRAGEVLFSREGIRGDLTQWLEPGESEPATNTWG